MRLRKCSKSPSPDFTLDEVQKVLTELRSGKCRDPSGLIREVFKYAGREFVTFSSSYGQSNEEA